MSFEELISVLGLGEMLTGDLFVTQLGVLAATAVFFVLSLVFCIMAFNAAGAARRARLEAVDLATEMRHLTAQVELSTGSRAPVRVGASELTDEAEVEIFEMSNSADNDEVPDRTLEAAKRAATVPSALLGGLLRRRS